MARTSSKIMSIADKKIAQTNLKTAIKQHADAAKGIAAEVKTAAATLVAAKKDADAQAKKTAAALSAAQKAHDAAVAKANKKADAAAKGASKLKDQLAALDAVPTSAPVKAAKATKADAAATAV